MLADEGHGQHIDDGGQILKPGSVELVGDAVTQSRPTIPSAASTDIPPPRAEIENPRPRPGIPADYFEMVLV